MTVLFIRVYFVYTVSQEDEDYVFVSILHAGVRTRPTKHPFLARLRARRTRPKHSSERITMRINLAAPHELTEPKGVLLATRSYEIGPGNIRRNVEQFIGLGHL